MLVTLACKAGTTGDQSCDRLHIQHDSMNEDSPSGSPYETLAEHDQSETKHDKAPIVRSISPSATASLPLFTIMLPM
jgi:hypothetical protein